MTKHRLLIVEFLMVERCRNDSSHYPPFYAGMARDAGAQPTRLRRGASAGMASSWWSGLQY